MDKRLLDEELNESFLEDELFWISREPWIFQANLILDSTMMVDLDDTIYQNKFLIIQGLKKWRRKNNKNFRVNLFSRRNWNSKRMEIFSLRWTVIDFQYDNYSILNSHLFSLLVVFTVFRMNSMVKWGLWWSIGSEWKIWKAQGEYSKSMMIIERKWFERASTQK